MDDKLDNVQLHHDAWPDKKLLFTEGCQEGGPHTGEWAARRTLRALDGERPEQMDIVGWVDWNLLLDETGGPNHVGNLCSAPIIADTQNDEVHFLSSYYYIGHFSRFIRPGARRVLSASTTDALEATAFINPDGSRGRGGVEPDGDMPVKFNLDHPEMDGGGNRGAATLDLDLRDRRVNTAQYPKTNSRDAFAASRLFYISRLAAGPTGR